MYLWQSRSLLRHNNSKLWTRALIMASNSAAQSLGWDDDASSVMHIHGSGSDSDSIMDDGDGDAMLGDIQVSGASASQSSTAAATAGAARRHQGFADAMASVAVATKYGHSRTIIHLDMDCFCKSCTANVGGPLWICCA